MNPKMTPDGPRMDPGWTPDGPRMGSGRPFSAGQEKPARPFSAGQEKPARPFSAGQEKPARPSVLFIGSCCAQRLIIRDRPYQGRSLHAADLGRIGGQGIKKTLIFFQTLSFLTGFSSPGIVHVLNVSAA